MPGRLVGGDGDNKRAISCRDKCPAAKEFLDARDAVKNLPAASLCSGVTFEPGNFRGVEPSAESFPAGGRIDEIGDYVPD